jgi:hypothetical protein
MAGNFPVPNGVEVKIVWGLAGIPTALNILHFSHAAAASMTQAVADAISALIKTSFTNNLAAFIHPTVSLLRVETRNMDNQSDPWFVTSSAAPPGTGTGNPLPAATAFCVSLKTGLRGRSYNGRVYLWGFASVANDTNGGITTAASTGAVAFIQGIDTNMSTTQSRPMAIVSRWTTPPGSPPNTPPTERPVPLLTDVTSIVALDSRWDVQRRRAVPGV